jgi:hypothetical protein
MRYWWLIDGKSLAELPVTEGKQEIKRYLRKEKNRKRKLKIINCKYEIRLKININYHDKSD